MLPDVWLCRAAATVYDMGLTVRCMRGVAVAAVGLAGFLSQAVHSPAYVPADLDHLFGGDGVIVSQPGVTDLATRHNLLMVSDGSILEVHLRQPLYPVCGYSVALERFAGNTGARIGSTLLPADSSCPTSIPQAVAIEEDERDHLFVATAEGRALRLTRLLIDGSVDTAFGAGGSVVFTMPQPVQPTLLRAWSDGEVLIAGRALQTSGPSSDTFVARVRPDGSLDPSFRGEGVSFFDVGLGESAPEPAALEVAHRGTFYLTGPLARSPAEKERRPIAVRAFLANGEVDQRFGREGVVKLDGAAAPAMTSIAAVCSSPRPAVACQPA